MKRQASTKSAYQRGGSFLVWILLDETVYHGGCPVISGSKVIVNKFIYTFDQFSKYLSSRQRKERVPPWDRSRF